MFRFLPFVLLLLIASTAAAAKNGKGVDTLN